MSYTFLFLLNFITLLFSVTSPVRAQCPVCIVTVGGGMLIARKLGIDDLLVSIWISALNTAISFWIAQKIKVRFLNNGYIVSILMLATTLVYFYYTDQTGAATIWGVDKIIFGQVTGLLAMMFGNHSYIFIKSKLGHTPFPYAKVVFPLSSVTIISLILKFVLGL